MSEKELIEYVLKNAANPTISTDVGLEAAQAMGDIAAREKIEWALCGGIAMYLFGSDRLTKDVDIIASDRLSLRSNAQLTFGGDNYEIEIGKYKIPVDWIVRNDGYQRYYRAALNETFVLPSGLKIITPEWLVILKIFAGRQKDLDDAVFLLKQRNGVRVDRPKVKENVVRIAGEDVWLAMLPEFRRLCDRADGRTTETGKYYDRD